MVSNSDVELFPVVLYNLFLTLFICTAVYLIAVSEQMTQSDILTVDLS
jgi:hypothetical protein